MPENDAEPDATIRPARQADLPGLLDLHRHLSPDDPAPDPVRAAEAWRRRLASDAVTVFVAQRGVELVSACTLAILPGLRRNTPSTGASGSGRDCLPSRSGPPRMQAAPGSCW